MLKGRTLQDLEILIYLSVGLLLHPVLIKISAASMRIKVGWIQIIKFTSVLILIRSAAQLYAAPPGVDSVVSFYLLSAFISVLVGTLFFSTRAVTAEGIVVGSRLGLMLAAVIFVLTEGALIVLARGLQLLGWF